MTLTPVNCNHCGAALEVSDTARFVTCRYCNSQLEIKRTESTISTEILERIDNNTAAMADDLQALRRESEIERLDREWALRRESLLTRNKDGTSSAPSIVGGIIAIVVGGGFGLIWTIGAASMGAPFVFPIFGVVFICLAVGGGIASITSAGRYEQAERDYQFRRRQLLSEHVDQGEKITG